MNKLTHIFKLVWAYKIKKATVLSYPPYQYTIESTNVCNFKCDFCPQSDPDHAACRPHGQLTIENFKLFLKKRRVVKPGNNNINFTLDGEPFINKNFTKFIELAAKDRLFSIFASNGSLINPEKADILTEAGPFRASIDFSSDKNIFETIRSKKDNYDKLLENLRYLINKARENENVNLEINDITTFAGVDPTESLAKMKNLFSSDIPSRVKFRTRVFHNFCGHLELGDEEKKKKYRLCPYPWTQMAVTHSGDCVACCRDTSARSIFGNIFEDDIEKIWNGEKYQLFRQNLLDKRPELNKACK
ncbi:MAG: radical SAM protein, partial [candidate division Zixibacteria bacterium]|nr:radical SAM protein [candidate division Zixibacteria bacterium]